MSYIGKLWRFLQFPMGSLRESTPKRKIVAGSKPRINPLETWLEWLGVTDVPSTRGVQCEFPNGSLQVMERPWIHKVSRRGPWKILPRPPTKTCWTDLDPKSCSIFDRSWIYKVTSEVDHIASHCFKSVWFRLFKNATSTHAYYIATVESKG